MKKLLLSIPIALLFIHFVYQSDGPNTWTQSLSGAGPVWSIAINPVNMQVMYAASNTTGIWKTTNGGLNWSQSNSGISNLVLNMVAVSTSNPSVVYCGGGSATAANGMYKSTDAGATWTAINTGITQTLNTVQSIAVNPTNPDNVLIAVWDGGTNNAVDGLYRTTNGGTSWSASNTGMGANKNVLCVAINPRNPNTIYCGTSFLTPNPPGTGPTFVYKSLNNGTSWSSSSSGLPTAATDINPIRYIDVSSQDTSIVILGMFYNTTTTNAGVYFTSNGGANWIQRSTGLPSAQATLPRSVLIRPGTTNQFFCGIAGTGVGGVYRTTDAGLTWTNFTAAPLTNTGIYRQFAFRTAGSGDSTLFVVNSGTTAPAQGVFEYTFVPLGINDPNSGIPTAFNLSQNYPNPFNPVTMIEYSVPNTAFVTIKIYNAAGSEVKSLVAQNHSPGNYYVSFSAEGLSSGVYFYKMEAGDFTGVKKMILVK